MATPKKSTAPKKPPAAVPTDFAAAHRKFLDEVRQRIDPTVGNLPHDLLIREKQQRIDRLQQRLSAVQEGRQQALTRFDSEIKDLEQQITTLKAEVERDRKRLDIDRPSAESAAPRRKTPRKKKKS